MLAARALHTIIRLRACTGKSESIMRGPATGSRNFLRGRVAALEHGESSNPRAAGAAEIARWRIAASWTTDVLLLNLIAQNQQRNRRAWRSAECVRPGLTASAGSPRRVPTRVLQSSGVPRVL
jgi:hypothetical protein